MDHDIPLITTLAAGFGFALVFGYIAEHFKTPALVGYLLAGVFIGPMTPGIVASATIAAELSELGVMLLMFGVGLHFSIKDLMAVKKIAIPGAIAQMGLATLLGTLVAAFWGWGWSMALIFGLSLSCASTVVLLKALEMRGFLETNNGHIAVGWLVVEDLACILILILMPPLAGLLGGVEPSTLMHGKLWWEAVLLTLLQIVVFMVLMVIVGRRVIPWFLKRIDKTGSRELFTLAVIASAITIAYGAAELFSVSYALGAFFSGMVMRESEFSHRAAEESLPLRDAFSVLFFVSVGMLFEPSILIQHPLKVLITVSIIIFGKSLVAVMLLLLYRYPLRTALIVAASLAQIGEFSFILAGLGLSLGLLSQEGMSLVLASALISMALNPLCFSLIDTLHETALKKVAWLRKWEEKSKE